MVRRPVMNFAMFILISRGISQIFGRFRRLVALFSASDLLLGAIVYGVGANGVSEFGRVLGATSGLRLGAPFCLLRQRFWPPRRVPVLLRRWPYIIGFEIFKLLFFLLFREVAPPSKLPMSTKSRAKVSL